MDQEGRPENRVCVNGLQKLIQEKAPDYSMRWCVQAYALNDTIINEKGEIDDLYGIYIPLGCFPTQREAEEHAKLLIEKTGYECIMVSKYGAAVPLTSKLNPNTIVDVPVDVRGKLISIEESKYQKENKLFEERKQRENEITQEAERETVFEDIEYLKRNWFLAVKHYSKGIHLEEESKKSFELYEKRKENIQKHIKAYPEHKEVWLPYLKEKLEKRGENDLYTSIEKGYFLLKDKVYI